MAIDDSLAPRRPVPLREPPEAADPADIEIRVFGVGGGGGNAVNAMADAELRHVRFIAANTDLQALSQSRADETVTLGRAFTRGLGAGARPEVGRDAALESREEIAARVRGADMVFVTAGMGGGTGTGAAPIVAEVAREEGALTVAVVTRPFAFEGKRRRRTAEEGIAALRQTVDTLLVIPNDRLATLAGQEMSTLEAFKLADRVLHDAVRGIVELIHDKGIVNADFADVKTVMSIPGLALMGLGSARGEYRAMEAAQRAMSSPLLEEVSITGARGILVNVTSDRSLRLAELTEAVGLIEEEAHDDAEVIFGWVIDESMGDEVRITVIATGIDPAVEVAAPPSPPRPKLERLIKVDPKDRVSPIQPWATVPATAEQWDLPPTVRAKAEAKAARQSVLQRDVRDVLRQQLDDELEHLDAPAYVRKLAD